MRRETFFFGSMAPTKRKYVVYIERVADIVCKLLFGLQHEFFWNTDGLVSIGNPVLGNTEEIDDITTRRLGNCDYMVRLIA